MKDQKFEETYKSCISSSISESSLVRRRGNGDGTGMVDKDTLCRLASSPCERTSASQCHHHCLHDQRKWAEAPWLWTRNFCESTSKDHGKGASFVRGVEGDKIVCFLAEQKSPTSRKVTAKMPTQQHTTTSALSYTKPLTMKLPCPSK